MKSLVIATFIFFTSAVYAAPKCDALADMSTEARERMLRLWSEVVAESKEKAKAEAKQREQEQAAEMARQNAEYAKLERAKKRALQGVKNFAEYSALSQNVKLDLLMFYGLYVMKNYKAEIISLKFEDVKDPQQKAYLIKAMRAVVDDEGGFDFRDDLGAETATFGGIGMTVKFLVAADGLILGADIRAEQWLVYTADVEGVPTHFNTEKEVRDAGLQVGPERYVGHAYLNEKAEIIKFSQMSYDH